MIARGLGLGVWTLFTVVAGCGSSFSAATPTADGGASLPDAGADACVPSTCADLHYSCGKADDGCGGTLACGDCKAVGFACSDEHACACVPSTCASLGFDCGNVPDGCGGMLSCGTCSGVGVTCGANGVPNKCGAGICTPISCQSQGVACGPLSDGCGDTLQCGACPAGETCGGGGAAGQCGCTAEVTCASHGYTCGDFLDSCNVEESCGPAPTEGSLPLCATMGYTHYYTCCPPGAVMQSGGSQDGGLNCTANGASEPLPGNNCVAMASTGGTIKAWCCAD
jgi:hypothetical protein